MKTVWKYDVPVKDEFSFSMPVGAVLLHVAVQGTEVKLWALVDPQQAGELRRFRLAGTGHPVEYRNVAHVGSFMLHSGALVFHLFEILP